MSRRTSNAFAPLVAKVAAIAPQASAILRRCIGVSFVLQGFPPSVWHAGTALLEIAGRMPAYLFGVGGKSL
eukprot:scaffold879_cov410-Prasinococcus_capsulatus_cf.AAC.7